MHPNPMLGSDTVLESYWSVTPELRQSIGTKVLLQWIFVPVMSILIGVSKLLLKIHI